MPAWPGQAEFPSPCNLHAQTISFLVSRSTWIVSSLRGGFLQGGSYNRVSFTLDCVQGAVCQGGGQAGR